MANEIKLPAQVTGKTVYFLIVNQAGQYWNGSSFETYATANRGDYDIAATELGTASGIYQATFPAGILSSGLYEAFGYMQDGANPAEPPTDILIGTVEIDWSGTSVVSAGTGSMSGSDFRAYILRGGFKRTDKDTELYEAVTDSIQDMRRRFGFSEAQAETLTTDTIAVLGDFKIDLESDFGLLNGIVMEDDDDATELVQLSKAKYDEVYPDINVTTDRGYPANFTLFNDVISLGPIPDQVSYVYRISYSQRAGTVSASTTAVPFTSLYREILRDAVLYRLWEIMDQYERSSYYRQKFEVAMNQAIHREETNRAESTFVMTGNDFDI